MDIWMRDFINTQATIGIGSLSVFAETLRGGLEAEMNPGEKQSGSMVRVAGYIESAGLTSGTEIARSLTQWLLFSRVHIKFMLTVSRPVESATLFFRIA